MSSASSILTTSNINSMVDSYIAQQQGKRLNPLTSRKDKYETISSNLTKVSSYTSSLTSALRTLSRSNSSSVYNSTTASSNNEDVITASSDKTASAGSYTLDVLQLAKSDLLLSNTATSSGTDFSSTANGKQAFTINTANGTATDYSSAISVELDGTETNQEYMAAIAYAINQDKAQVTSDGVTLTDAYSGGDTSISITVGDVDDPDNEDTFSIDISGAATYEDVLNEIVDQINNDVDNLNASIVDNGDGTSSVQITSASKSFYFSIDSSSAGYDIAADLNIEAAKEIAASEVMTASTYTPASGQTQLSITSDMTGLDHRITSISDDAGSSALSQVGLNLGAARTAYDDVADTAGYVYADVTEANNELNAKYTMNGIAMQSASNSVEDVVSGVTFNLLAKTEAGSPVTVTIEKDTDSVVSSIKSFVEAFNSLYTYVKDQTASRDGIRGTLRGESTVESLLSQLTSMVYSDWGQDSDSIRTLSQIGISFDSEMGLTVNDSDLEDAIESYGDEVENLFNGSNGIATGLYSSLKEYTGAEGYLTISKDNYDDSADYLDGRIARVEDSIDSGAELLRSKYTRMQQQLAVLLSTESLFS
jgi:flagellar hook-associated protein 2